MGVVYIGRFPPPYGGVTIKNKIVFDNLSKKIDIQTIDLGLIKNLDIREVTRLITFIISPSSTFIIGSASTSRRLFSGLLYYINRKALNRSLLIVMGGIASNIMSKDPKYLKWVKEFKQIYVETEGMKSDLTNVGAKNVAVFPNCRENPKEIIEIKKHSNKRIRCIYFSLISKDKGADIVIEASRLLYNSGINYSIDFYGHIEDEYKNEFERSVQETPYVNYCGVFRADQESVYIKMQEYDLMLFPTRSVTEGVPGVLVESKIAGIPSIVSNLCFNSELVKDGKEGIVLKQNTAGELADAIKSINRNVDWLFEMKYNARTSSERYIIENYVEEIAKMLKR